MFTDINDEDRLVQKTFADHLHKELGWDSLYAYNTEVFGSHHPSPPAKAKQGEGVCDLGRANEREVVLTRDLSAAITRLNPTLPPAGVQDAVNKITAYDFSRSTLQHNRDFYRLIRDGVPVSYRDANNTLQSARAQLIDFRDATKNRFLAVRELKIHAPAGVEYHRRADLVCFVNGLPLVFIELKAVYRHIRHGFDGNITDYYDTIPHAFHHNAFLVVSNGDSARYGSITSKWEHFAEWKRNGEREKGDLQSRTLLDGMLSKKALLDLVENFILFDDSKPGGTRKIVARNHQFLGVNLAVASVQRQEDLKRQFPVGERLRYRVVELQREPRAAKRKPDTEASVIYEIHTKRKTDTPPPAAHSTLPPQLSTTPTKIPLIERAHPDLGRLGVFWHTQGSGKSYSMAFFVEKVRRTIDRNFTFVIMTDREDLDDQIFKTFFGCAVADDKTPRSKNGADLEKLLNEDHRFIFSLIHKFNRPLTPDQNYSTRDDIIVISDEAHRTQAGKLARNMRLALPNASFIGFTGTPILKGDLQTRRIFGGYVSRYDFRRSEEDKSTVKLVYENRGEKLGLTRVDLNDKILEKIEQADLDPEKIDKLHKLLGKDYEVLTAPEVLKQIADDFVEYCTERWQTGKSMLVCLDKITCGRMYALIIPRWRKKTERIRALVDQKQAALPEVTDPDDREQLAKDLAVLRHQLAWLEQTIVQFIISESQNEIKAFKEWKIDIRPHRDLMKRGFETPDGKRIQVDEAFKDPDHPFRVAIVCAMWLTGFDVESLATLYLNKPMKAHTLMQAIARANRIYPNKTCGVIVDYNGVLESLNKALADYALGDEDDTGGGETHEDPPPPDLAAPIEELMASLVDAIEAAEIHLRSLGFEPARLKGARGFDRIEAFRDAVNALNKTQEARRRFQVIVHEMMSRFNALVMDPSVFQYVERRDNLETICKKLDERIDTADVTALLKELHRIVSDAVATQGRGDDQATGLKVDLSKIDFQRLRDEFAKKVKRKFTALRDIQDVVEARLAKLLRVNPNRIDYYKQYQQIIADYNREKDRTTVEETFARLFKFIETVDAEQQRHIRENLSEEELALFDLVSKETLTKKDREKLKQASKALLAALQQLLKPMPHWTHNTQTQAEVEVFILDRISEALPTPPYTTEEAETISHRVYGYIFQRSASGDMFAAAA
jgi:type I restriction enzyme R subunit